jgi:hypothetical protein
MPGSHATAETAWAEVFTVIHDLAEGRDLAWVRGAIWPPVGTVVELRSRHALVVGIRLVLTSGERALVRVDVQNPGEGEFIARDAGTRLVEDELTCEDVEAVGVDLRAAPTAE